MGLDVRTRDFENTHTVVPILIWLRNHYYESYKSIE